MGRRIRDYVKYTFKELECYIKSKGSCVKKVNNVIHLNLPPYGMYKLKDAVFNIIAKKKIGVYDPQLNGIVLDIRNIKIIGNVGAIRFDSPVIHININADTYYFQPSVGSVVRGVVSHVSARQVGVIIYRVFNVSIRLKEKIDNSIEVNSEIEFRIKNFDLENCMPYIEGELVAKEVNHEYNNNMNVSKHIFIASSDDSSNSAGESDWDRSDNSLGNANVKTTTEKFPNVKDQVDSDPSDEENPGAKISNMLSNITDSDSSTYDCDQKSFSSKINGCKQVSFSEENSYFSDESPNKKSTKNKNHTSTDESKSEIKKQKHLIGDLLPKVDDVESSTKPKIEIVPTSILKVKTKKNTENDIEKVKKRLPFTTETNPLNLDNSISSEKIQTEKQIKEETATAENAVNSDVSETGVIMNGSNISSKTSLQTSSEKIANKKPKLKNDSTTPNIKPKKKKPSTTTKDVHSQMLDILTKVKFEKRNDSDISNNSGKEILTNGSNKKSKSKKNSDSSSLEGQPSGKINSETDSTKPDGKSKKKKSTKNTKDVSSQMLDILSKVKLEKSIESANESAATTNDTDTSTKQSPVKKQKKKEKNKSKSFDETLLTILAKVKTEKNNEVTKSNINKAKRKSTEKIPKPQKKSKKEELMNDILSKVRSENSF